MRRVNMNDKNLMSAYFTMLNLTISGGLSKLTPDGRGDVSESSAPSKDAYCTEPVKSITVAVDLTKDLYFVPAFDFQGIKINGSALTTTDVVADTEGLYMVKTTTSESAATTYAVSKVSL